MISHAVLAHGDDAGVTHMGGNTVWMLISMIAFSIFLISIAWTLIRPTRQVEPTAADIATKRFAHGEIGDDELWRALRDIDTPRPSRRHRGRGANPPEVTGSSRQS